MLIQFFFSVSVSQQFPNKTLSFWLRSTLDPRAGGNSYFALDSWP